MRPAGRAPARESPAPAGAADTVELGRIVGRHGVRGDLRLLPHNPDAAIFSTLSHVLLQRDGGVARRRLINARPHKRVLLVHLEGVDTADAAEALVGSTVAVERAALPRLAPGEVYYLELIGCRVVTETGTPLGVVTRVFPTGSNDVCEVQDDTHEYLIPLIADVVVRWHVTPPERVLIIRPIPGLLDGA